MLSTRYNPKDTEEKWYDHWLKKDYFHSTPDEREAYSIVIPPPNVTGVLHMGHMLNNTIQDILIRRARLQGKNACWVPGTDHASIATEAKVVKMLREKGIKKSDLSREEFLNYAFEWKDKYGGIILDQLRKLGASCDWSRTRFTMEPKMSEYVLKIFIDMYRKGLVYRDLRITNWDPEALTVLSNEEVIHKDEKSHLYHIKYAIEGTDGEFVTIATQRPETIMADVAVAVNPNDDRFNHLIGKNAIIPLVNRAIPIIGDTYVDVEFGTGALKITPAHDPNDSEIGKKHNLPVIDILNANGTLNEKAEVLVGEDRFVARKKIKPLLEEAGVLVQLEEYTTSIGRSERTNAVVEPRLTLQWFVNMKEFARKALNAVESKQVTFYPESMWNMYNNWLREDNVRDWCISRQLWWGQQIPAWYYEDKVFVAETAEEALTQAQKELGNANLTLSDLTQDEDVVDTWFSSWLWPISVFDGFENTEELRYYYPTSVLVTGWDIMFFWVARMIMSGYEWSGELLGMDHVLKHGRQPFNDVYFTGMVRDSKRRKMSKSLGNSPDALKLIENYGADGVRYGMLSCAAAGNDIVFDAPMDPKTKKALNESKLCETGRNFCNKMWNALRLVKGWEIVDKEQDAVNVLAIQWLEEKMSKILLEVESNYDQYRLSDVLIALRGFIWDDFCSWYLEMIKPNYGDPIDRATIEKTISIFEKLMTLLHPFMPFITEEIWQQLKDRKEGEDCVISQYPSAGDFDKDLISKVEKAKDVTTKIREVRQKNGVKNADKMVLFVEKGTGAEALFALNGIKEMISKMAGLSAVNFTDSEPENAVNFVSGTEKYFVPVEKKIDIEAEREKLEKELKHAKGFVFGIEKKLGNARFVDNAPPAVVEKERQKMADGKERIRILEDSLKNL
ncbi:MAG: valine--tRNA ligase [Saprospiraceae bacterium]|jgi:valyl-tRNA synthetase|nr:valine--tRNA ligase [Saprospiraceae bacterium]